MLYNPSPVIVATQFSTDGMIRFAVTLPPLGLLGLSLMSKSPQLEKRSAAAEAIKNIFFML